MSWFFSCWQSVFQPLGSFRSLQGSSLAAALEGANGRSVYGVI